MELAHRNFEGRPDMQAALEYVVNIIPKEMLKPFYLPAFESGDESMIFKYDWARLKKN